MSRKGVGGAAAGLTAHLPPHTLPRPALPSDQLQTVQKRLLQLLRAVSEVEAQVGGPEKLDDWPTLLSRHLNLVSQIYTLSNALLSSTPHHVPSQLAELDRILSEEAKGPDNLYAPSGEGVADDGTAGPAFNASDALFGGRKPDVGDAGASTTEKVLTSSGVPLPVFSDVEHASLPFLSVHPYTPLDADKANTLSGVLRSRVDPEVEEEQEAVLSSWRAQLEAEELAAYGGGREGQEAARKELEAEAERRGLQPDEWRKRRELLKLREEGRKWDEKVAMALRSWYHAKEAPDEEGMRYDWKMRDVGDEEDEVEGGGEEVKAREGEKAQEAESLEAPGKRKRGARDEEEEWTAEDLKSFLKAGENR